LPSGSKKRYKRSRGSKKKTSEPTASSPQTTSGPDPIIVKPAEVKAPEFDVDIAQEVVFKPNPGPQTNFLSASEREVLYGGAAGGGKSYAMLADPLHGLNDPNFSGLLVRHTTEELRELIQKSQELYPKAVPGIKWSERKSQWISPRGGRLWMSYLDKDMDVTRYQGQAFNWIGFDELTQWPTPYALQTLVVQGINGLRRCSLTQRQQVNLSGLRTLRQVTLSHSLKVIAVKVNLYSNVDLFLLVCLTTLI
jgi:hypothetical protein